MMKLLILTSLILSFIAFPALAGPVPDTGQTKCYNNTEEIPCPLPGEPFYGQDAQYTCNPHSYTDLGNGIVRDNVTGLMWQKATASDNYTWSGAITYCDNLVLGGYSDWRLPTISELATLVDSSIPDPGPTINTTYFPGTVASDYWSSTTFVNDTNDAWYVCFVFGGVSYYSKTSYYSYSQSYVRAVRGGQSNNNFVDNGDGTVSDTVTGLMWQKATAPGTYSWEQALTYCENLTFAGHSDWRLPNRNELQSIVDYSRHDPSINTTYFPFPVGSHYWSSTTLAVDYDIDTWVVSFYYGLVGGYYSTYGYYVRAVRGGQCGSFDNSTSTTLCPAEQAVGSDNKEVLAVLRDFRDKRMGSSAEGLTLITLYYNHADEITRIFSEQQALLVQARKIILELIPLLEQTLEQDRHITLSESHISKIASLLKSISFEASPSMQKSISFVLKQLETGKLLKGLNG